MRIEKHFHMNGFQLNLILKMRLEATRQWPVGWCRFTTCMISAVITCSYDISRYHVQLSYQSLSRAVIISVVSTCSYEISRFHVRSCSSSLSRAVPVMISVIRTHLQ